MTNILFIEPDRILAETYYQALTHYGYDVIVTPSAQTAIMIADQFKPDLIVLELQLIEHSGIEFLYELRSYVDWQKLPVIIQTQVPPGEFANNWRLLKQELGIADYLYKPNTSLHQLINAIRDHVPVTT